MKCPRCNGEFTGINKKSGVTYCSKCYCSVSDNLIMFEYNDNHFQILIEYDYTVVVDMKSYKTKTIGTVLSSLSDEALDKLLLLV